MINNELKYNKDYIVDFDEYYIKNIWDLSKHPHYEADSIKRPEIYKYMKKISFEYTDNLYIRQELKKFLMQIIENKNLGAVTIAKNAIFTKHFGKFVTEYFPEITSVLDVEYDVILKEFCNYIEENNMKVMVRTTSTITKDLIKIEGVYHTNTIYVLQKFYNYILNVVYPDSETEYEKDKWDVRLLRIKINIAESNPKYCLNFEEIAQPNFKEVCKKYLYHRLPIKKMSTLMSEIAHFKCFSKFLTEYYPKFKLLSELDRHLIENYISYIGNRGYTTSTFNGRLSTLKTFFEIIPFLEVENVPKKKLITNNDFRKNVQLLPNFYSDNELKQLNKHISELPQQIARMLFVIENVGMRISELCILTENCIKKIDDDKYILTYYQPKTYKDNVIPINGIVGTTIEEAIKFSKTKFGDKCKYVFANSVSSTIKTDTFSYHLNLLAYKKELKFDDGTPFRIKSHTFRGTVATQYANLGISMEVIRMMLGQAKIGVLKHYITIHSISMVDCMKPITDEDNELIGNMGHVEDIYKVENRIKNTTPLINGECCKSINSGKCTHANACYSCRMFRPSKGYLSVFKSQLREAENNIAIANINGFKLLMEINSELKTNLECIIQEIEKESQKNEGSN